ncbi:MAG: hypothetical protein FWE22_06990 [Firmicutes bacterium]|nr:hypothetical protein [Bacillota bacterium]
MFKLKKFKIALAVLLAAIMLMSVIVLSGCDEEEEYQLWVPQNFEIDTNLIASWTSAATIGGHEIEIRQGEEVIASRLVLQGGSFSLMSLRLPLGVYYATVRAIGGERDGNVYLDSSFFLPLRAFVITEVWCDYYDEPCECEPCCPEEDCDCDKENINISCCV